MAWIFGAVTFLAFVLSLLIAWRVGVILARARSSYELPRPGGFQLGSINSIQVEGVRDQLSSLHQHCVPCLSFVRKLSANLEMLHCVMVTLDQRT